ncbi:SCO3374 family protein [Streptomyces sp. LaPpAH-108]|uniref:SCO3374 family protein n=1 Tax=Streptomyces sp. LaPpAH-108 TaxID=1155714 RepID=UPI0009962A9E|nr:SCO3374 family protein [Streptomyces sp. LaPpAH-108]
MSSVLPASAIPGPRRPSPGSGPARGAAPGADRHWYEGVLGWPTAPGRPLRLLTGVRFDALDVPAEAGAAALRHLGPYSPVARCGDRMLFLVAAGAAEELPGLLEWLEWGPLAPDLRALGAGGLMTAPVPPGPAPEGTRRRPDATRGTAVWLRPPGPGRRAETALPALPAVGGTGGAPDLVRLVGTVAAECHRVRLRRAGAGPDGRARARPSGHQLSGPWPSSRRPSGL